MRFGTLIIALLLLGVIPLHAQTLDACLDRRSQPIKEVTDNSLPYAGVATVLPDGTPIILYNTDRLKRATPMARRFVHLHECGHHQLRHVYRDPTRVTEIEADCWAVRYLVQQEIVKERHLDELQAEIGAARGMGSLKGCVTVQTDPELWHRSLSLLELAGAHKFEQIKGRAIVDDPEDGFFESTLDLPGIFNCELTPEHSFHCLLFDGRSEKAARRHFRKIRDIVMDWVDEDWMTFERVGRRPSETVRFVAQAIESGAMLTLITTGTNQVLFTYQANP